MSLGIWQLVLILVIVLLLFGAGKLPRLMGDMAQGIKNFRSGLKEDEPAAPPAPPPAVAQPTQPATAETVSPPPPPRT